ncbi:uncharacterized protein LOC129941427 [Eupeodes corollae]|uniref:uncharacterized protein LOC129941427 n=1 Tax=Eupeodes corollae TaxID=290404 RepID=UPI0024935928|nr:uncharacterized protein LOC129941427 [Eupeodes corollae]
MQKTGGGPFEEVEITEDDEKIIQLTSIRKAVSGLKCPSFGAPSPSTAATTLSVASALASAAPSTAPSSSDSKIVKSPQHSPGNEPVQNRKRYSTPFVAASTPKRRKQKDTNELLNAQIENDSIFQDKLLNILRERNEQDAMFQARVIEQLERRNDIAEKQLQKGYF